MAVNKEQILASLTRVAGPDGRPLNIFDFDFERVRARRIRFGEHCLGCTAGAGSSCGGATT